MTLVCLLIPWKMLQLVMNSSTLSLSPMKISGSLPIILSDSAPGSAASGPPAGLGLPPPPPPPLLRSSWTLCSTWAGRLRPSLLACWRRSFCFRYSVRALGLWQYGWYVVTRVWEISQAYEVVQGEVWRSCAIELDCYKNSDLGSEVGTDKGLNSTTLRL